MWPFVSQLRIGLSSDAATPVLQGQNAFGITSELIMCFVKHLPVSSALDAVREMHPFVQNGDVIGLGADSSEVNNPRALFVSLCIPF